MLVLSQLQYIQIGSLSSATLDVPALKHPSKTMPTLFKLSEKMSAQELPLMCFCGGWEFPSVAVEGLSAMDVLLASSEPCSSFVARFDSLQLELAVVLISSILRSHFSLALL